MSLTSATNKVVEDWLADIEAKEMIEGDYTHCGIAAVRNNKTSFSYFTMLFAKVRPY